MSDFSAISQLKFPFRLKEDQTEAVHAWINNNYRGTILYSTGTGKTEIAFECARRIASEFSTTIDSPSPIDILLMVPRIILIEQNIHRLVTYGIPREKIGAYFGERKEVKEIRKELKAAKSGIYLSVGAIIIIILLLILLL